MKSHPRKRVVAVFEVLASGLVRGTLPAEPNLGLEVLEADVAAAESALEDAVWSRLGTNVRIDRRLE